MNDDFEDFYKWVVEELNPSRENKPLSREEALECFNILENFKKEWNKNKVLT